nr:L-serine ammonia-lyase [Actinomycetales bacterium]
MAPTTGHISVTDLFSIGIGPSSSHTVGPMKAALHFARTALAATREGGSAPARVVVELYGSLAATGRGHATDRAVQWGLAGHHPRTCPDQVIQSLCPAIAASGTLRLGGELDLPFDPARDIEFHPRVTLPQHVNGVRFRLEDAAGEGLLERTYCSVGGGFVTLIDDDGAQVPLTVSPDPGSGAVGADGASGSAGEGVGADLRHTVGEEGGTGGPAGADVTHTVDAVGVPGGEEGERGEEAVPYPFTSGAELLARCAQSGLSVAGVVWANELASRTSEQLEAELDEIWAAMNACVEAGLEGDGTLPGGLNVPRRAGRIHDELRKREVEGGERATYFGDAPVPGEPGDPLLVMDWLNLYALAVNEENASGHRVVTAPTNGAAGVVPAVISYYVRFLGGTAAGVRRFLLAATAIGTIVKLNASIAGAEVGCQGEVGSASAMAAAGLAEVMGGTPAQVENAAEIAMEHNLGLTCDPIGGLVQIPCIERNAVGAVKSVNAARLAMWGDGTHTVSLDAVVETMRQTGADMKSKYKETSEGGLAVNVVEC